MTNTKDIFVNIKAVSRVRDAVSFAMLMPYPARVISPPGLGKSTALRHLAREFDGAYLEIGATDKDIVGMYRAIMRAIGGTTYGVGARDVLRNIEHQMKHRARYSLKGKDLLIVDEFQALEDTAKRELLRIHEASGFALVLSSNPERLESSNRRSSGAIQQVEDRIGLNMKLPPIDDEDCDLIAGAYGVADKDALAAIRALGAKSNAREVARTLQFAKLVATDSTHVRLTHIKRAVTSLKGATTALDRLKS